MTHEIIPYRKLRPSKSSLTIRIIGKNHCSHSDYGLINVWTAIMVLQKVKAFLPCQLQVLSTCFWQRRRVFTRNDLSRSIRDPALRLRTAKLWSRVSQRAEQTMCRYIGAVNHGKRQLICGYNIMRYGRFGQSARPVAAMGGGGRGEERLEPPPPSDWLTMLSVPHISVFLLELR